MAYLVTGASKGIGLAIAKGLIAEGKQVIGLSRTRGSFSHQDYTHVSIDLGNLNQLPHHLKALKIDSLEGIISNVGMGLFGHLEQYSFEQMRQIIDLNFLSHTYLVRHFIPQLKKQGSGKIIFIGSEAALEGKRKGTLYCASKFAMKGFAEALRDEVAPAIQVGIVHPGMVETSFFDQLDFRPESGLKSEDVAKCVLSMLQMEHGGIDEVVINPPQSKILFGTLHADPNREKGKANKEEINSKK